MKMSTPWWKTSVVYQVWPASFKDSNGDGIGDIQGLISKLGYIQKLGVGVIWLSPMFDSPQIDMGYDVSNYEAVYPPYGTVKDMEELVQQVHQHGMRIILDLVVNHTSDQHAWFKESRSSKDNKKRDWYIWRPARWVNGERKPPTNWRANVGGSAWAWDETTQQYYFHLFSEAQPDLNWDNEDTRQALFQSAVKFWLSIGVDGFRIDTCNLYSKDQSFPDAEVTDPQSEYQAAADHFANGPRMHEFMIQLRSAMSPHDVMTVGELPHTKTLEKVLAYIKPEGEKQLDMVFMFDTVTLGHGKPTKLFSVPWTLENFKASIARQQEVANRGGWTTSFLENHDHGRSIPRFGSETPGLAERSGKALAMILISLTGTLFLYQGQEIGMRNIPDSWDMDEYKDELTQNHLQLVASRSYANENERQEAKSRALRAIRMIARDHSRTPMQWDDSPGAGFGDGTPWMRVNPNFSDINVAKQTGDPDSVLSFWRRAIRFRAEHFGVLGSGRFRLVEAGNPSIVAFVKEHGDAKATFVANFSDEPQSSALVGSVASVSAISLSNLSEGEVPIDDSLAPWEARICL